MNVSNVLEQLDKLFAKHDIQAIEAFLTKQLEISYEEQDFSSCVTILNELIGFYRDLSKHDKAIKYCDEVLSLMNDLGLSGTIAFATTLLNIANAYRAASLLEEALAIYNKILPIYESELSKTDIRFASFYNNLSLLYQEMNRFEDAVDCQYKALDIISILDDEIKIAITHSNLGASLLQLGKTKDAIHHLSIALNIFDKYDEKDFHYSAAMHAMGNAYFTLHELEKALEYYCSALEEQYKQCGKSDAYYRILDNLNIVEKALGIPVTKEQDTNKHIKGLELSRMFYEEIGKKAIECQYPELLSQISIGLVGEGSECFGFDDHISTDHDFGPGFCIWMPEDLYVTHGQKLQVLYDTLPTTFKGYTRIHKSGKNRIGVLSIDRFFKQYVGYRDAMEIPDSDAVFQISDDGMATILNGAIFHDPNKQFSNKRNAFYDAFTEEIWNVKIAKSLMELGQYGQSNYPRAMKRGDYVTAQITLYKYVETLLQLVHYLNHKFPPYYKWLKKSASKLERLAVLSDLTNALADFADSREAFKEDASGATDKVLGTIEIIASLIIHELKETSLIKENEVSSEELFLEVYGQTLYQNTLIKIQNQAKPTKDQLIETLIQLEWNAFDKVENIGGRADCQDDINTFTIMRKSQYLTWTDTMLQSYIHDFEVANRKDWNLITEKYARMMRSTNPSEYEQLKNNLPSLTDRQVEIIEEIVKIQVDWMEDFAIRYPNLASNSRSIHTYEDTPWNTSYETYLRGELSTYSEKTLKLYGDFIVTLLRDKENLAEMTMRNTTNLYGYTSLEEAERVLL